MSPVRAPWSHASFLVYFGGITILGATFAFLAVEGEEHAAAAFVGWALLAFAVLAVLASTSRRRGRFVTAGLYALSAVAAFVVFLGALLDWFGWLPDLHHSSVFRGFRFWVLVLELAAVVASATAWRIYRFPLLVLAVAASSWFFVTDLISGGGDWTAIVTIAYGLVLLAVAVSVDAGDSRITGFWLHVVAGVTIGGGLLWFFHDGDWDWIVIGIAALAYMALGDRLLRSSWVVLAAWALLQTTTHFAEKWADVTFLIFFPFGFFLFPFVDYEDLAGPRHHMWLAPLAYAVLGLALIAVGQVIALRRRAAIPAAELL
jgi:hypothetical protein